MKKHILEYIHLWETRCYNDGIPEQAPVRLEQLNKAPSYKSIVRAILKNDKNLKTLGYEPKKSKIYHELKRIELANRGENKQLKLFE